MSDTRGEVQFLHRLLFYSRVYQFHCMPLIKRIDRWPAEGTMIFRGEVGLPFTSSSITLPAAVRAGMSNKFLEAIRNPVDGHPATRGTPMESEVKYYHNFYLSHGDFPFDAFVDRLCREVSMFFPGTNLSLDWIRECDRRATVASARRELIKLRACVEHKRVFRISFWGMLWKVSEVYLDKFRLSYADIGTSLDELQDMVQRQLRSDCNAHVRTLRSLIRQAPTGAVRREFLIVDDMLKGVPIPAETFLSDHQNIYSATGAYALYARMATGNPIDPAAVGWSVLEHLRCENIVFPKGRPSDRSMVTSSFDPTAVVAAIGKETEIPPAWSVAMRPADALFSAPLPAIKKASSWIETAEKAFPRIFALAPLVPISG